MRYLLKEKSISGPVNVVAPIAQKNTAFIKTLAKALHRIAIIPVPKIILKCLMGESSCLLLDSQRVSPQKLLNSGFSFAFHDLDEAMIDLLKPTSMEGF